MPIYEELFYLGTGRYVDFMRSSLRRSLITQTDKLIYAEISGQTQEIVAGNDELARTFGEGFDATNRTLEWGFTNIADRLSEVSSAIEDLQADFNYSIGLVIEQMQIQNKLLSQVIEKLDAIHKTLESPLLTQAREFYRIGGERLQRGLIDKALEAFLKAEEKNDTDFFTEFQLGKLYLYGIDEDDNVIDLKKAQEHLRLAVRYGKGELKVLPNFNRWVGEAFFHAAIAYYVSVNEPEIKENPTEVKRSIEEAHDLVRESCEIYPQISEAYYHYAKFSALLGDAENTISNLEKAILMDRRYCIKSEIDKDFDAVRPKVIELYEKLRKDSEIKARDLLNEAKEHLSKLYLYSEAGKTVKGEAEKLIHDAEILIEKNTYFSYLDAIPYLNRAIEISSSYYEKGGWATCSEHLILEGGIIESTRRYKVAETYTGPIAFSPDGKFLAIGYVRVTATTGQSSTEDKWYIQIRDANDGEFIRTLGKGEPYRFGPIAFSPDGKFLASGLRDSGNIRKSIQIWDTNNWQLIRTLEEYNNTHTIAFSHDSKSLVVAGGYDDNGCLIRIWDVNEWRLRILKADIFVHAMALSPDSKLLAIGGFNWSPSGKSEYSIQIRDTNEGKLLRTLGEADALAIAFSPNGKFLAIGVRVDSSATTLIQIWDTNNWQLIRTLKSNVFNWRLVFSPDGKFLATTNTGWSQIEMWYINDGSLVKTLKDTTDEAMAFNPDGKLLATIKHLETVPLDKKGPYGYPPPSYARNAITIWRKNA